jgi:hypothetical protein
MHKTLHTNKLAEAPVLAEISAGGLSDLQVE